VAGFRREGKGEKNEREARDGRGRLQRRYCFLRFFISSRIGSAVVHLPPNERLDHCSVSLVREVTSAFYANYHAGSVGEKKVEFVTPTKIKPVSKDVLYVDMFWKIQENA